MSGYEELLAWVKSPEHTMELPLILCAAHRERRIFLYPFFLSPHIKTEDLSWKTVSILSSSKPNPSSAQTSLCWMKPIALPRRLETGIVPVTLSLYACDKRDTAARRAWDNFGVVTEMVPLGLLSGCLLLSQAYEDADVLIDDCLYLDQPLGEMVDQLRHTVMIARTPSSSQTFCSRLPHTIRMYWMPS